MHFPLTKQNVAYRKYVFGSKEYSQLCKMWSKGWPARKKKWSVHVSVAWLATHPLKKEGRVWVHALCIIGAAFFPKWPHSIVAPWSQPSGERLQNAWRHVLLYKAFCCNFLSACHICEKRAQLQAPSYHAMHIFHCESALSTWQQNTASATLSKHFYDLESACRPLHIREMYASRH